MKARKNITIAGVMLIVSLISLITASYAWMTIGKEVEVKAPKFTASAQNNLEISWNDINNGEWSDWAFSVNINLGDMNDWRLMPASSYSGTNDKLFYTEELNDGESDDYTEFKRVAIRDDITQSKKNGYYIDVPLRIRTTGADNVKVALDTQESKIIDISKSGENVGSISKAVRIAFINSDGTKNSLGNEIDVNFGDNKDIAPFVFNINNEFNGKVIIGLTGKDKITPFYLNKTVQILDIKGKSEDLDNYLDGTEFIARIWLEGEDSNCRAINGGKSFAISLKFIAID